MRRELGRELERRLRRLELASSGPGKVELWIDQADGTLIGPNGERITEEAFLCLDPPENSGVRFVMSATDAGL